MSLLTPVHELGEYLARIRSGEIRLPDFQRKCKLEDGRIRQLLVTVSCRHPLGAVMQSGDLAPGAEAKFVLLGGQQRLTPLTQAVSRQGVVMWNTKTEAF